ncbi:hypothetical protein N2152v2_008906 [Parachlorella kessleri]
MNDGLANTIFLGSASPGARGLGEEVLYKIVGHGDSSSYNMALEMTDCVVAYVAKFTLKDVQKALGRDGTEINSLKYLLDVLMAAFNSGRLVALEGGSGQDLMRSLNDAYQSCRRELEECTEQKSAQQQVASILEFIDQRCSPREQQQQQQQCGQQGDMLDMSPSKRKEPGHGPSPVLDAGSTIKKHAARVEPLLPMAAAGAAAAAAIAAEPSQLTSDGSHGGRHDWYRTHTDKRGQYGGFAAGQFLLRLGIVALLALAGADSQAEQTATTDPNAQSPPRQPGDLISFGSKKSKEPQFCVIVRTYWGHSGGEQAGLRRLIRSLQRQTVGTQYMPKKDANEWMPGYHGMLYNLTDDAIQGVNVLEAGDVDLVAFDFYSRFQRPTAPACERFAAWSDRPHCKRNRLKWCHTDLGANAINYPRLLAEKRRFGTLQSELGLQEDHYDGIMAQALVAAGWRAVNYEGLCLFSHAPNPQWCGWQGGVWDDTDMVSWSSAGGRCITLEDRAQILAADPEVEEVMVWLSNDGNVSVFEGVDQSQMEIRCLRKRDTLTPQLRAMHWYSTWCTEEADLPGFEYLMAQHGTQAPLQEQQVPVHPDLYQLQAQFQHMGAAVVPEQPPHERPAGWVPEVRRRYDPPQEDLASQAEQQQIWQHELVAQEQHLAAQQQHLQQPQRPQEWADVAVQEQTQNLRGQGVV